MATPRVFVSSTCIDFQETRRQLRQFIQDYAFEPVMSDFNDIFYDFNSHVQDACKNEINRCNLFILIVGNQYRSIYYKQKASETVPESVTLKEFRKALEIEIPKHIFIDRFVKHDYDNYSSAMTNVYSAHFDKHEVPEKKILQVKQKLRREFDRNYPFPQQQYKYVFHFLDLIHELPSGNAVITFETFEDIKESLKRQWAGLIYEALDRDSNISSSDLVSLEAKVDKVAGYLQDLLGSKKNHKESGKVTLDTSKVARDIEKDKFDDLKQRTINSIRLMLRPEFYPNAIRAHFAKRPSVKAMKDWVKILPSLLKKYKWADTINVRELFPTMVVSWYTDHMYVPINAVKDFQDIYTSLGTADQESVLHTFIMQIEPLVKKDEDDIPF